MQLIGWISSVILTNSYMCENLIIKGDVHIVYIVEVPKWVFLCD
jgi:hypothetical protein